MQGSPSLDDAPRIGLSEAEAKFEMKTAVFVDVRTSEEFERSHIPGAISMPLREFGRRAGELPRDRSIIFY
ncbi:MAG: rhodanese-like domain-containing protein [Chloroflexi bacterium]|nr:rhodanese-like domain-containing protein [Chloroflexota bacterium]